MVDVCQGVNIRTVYQALTILVIVSLSGHTGDLAPIIGLDQLLGWWEAAVQCSGYCLWCGVMTTFTRG